MYIVSKQTLITNGDDILSRTMNIGVDAIIGDQLGLDGAENFFTSIIKELESFAQFLRLFL